MRPATASARGLAAALAASALWGCGQPSDPGERADRAARRTSEQTAGEIDTAARLDVAEQRIARLERQLAELRASPTAVDNELLKQQLGATQAALYARAQSRDAEPAPQPSASATPRPRATATPQPAPTVTPRLKLVDPRLFNPDQSRQPTP